MSIILVSFLTSSFLTYFLIRFEHLHSNISGDHDRTGPQKIHERSVPRIGGVSIFIGLLAGSILIAIKDNIFNSIITILFACVPVFGIGLIEDFFKNISVKKRIFLIAIGSIIAFTLIPASITSIDTYPLDLLLSFTVVSFLFSCFALTGLTNAYNIIDGFHGLSSMIAIITLGAISYIAFKQHDLLLFKLSLCMLSSILGFFIWNYPKGHIFLGDGGAYLIGFFIAILSIMLVERNNNVSPWFAFSINIYPIFETLFTIYRRKLKKSKSAIQPDRIHFHSLFYRRVIGVVISKPSKISSLNHKTAPFFWILTIINAIPVIYFYHSTTALQVISLLFIFIYCYIYRLIVVFRSPKWLHFY